MIISDKRTFFSSDEVKKSTCHPSVQSFRDILRNTIKWMGKLLHSLYHNIHRQITVSSKSYFARTMQENIVIKSWKEAKTILLYIKIVLFGHKNYTLPCLQNLHKDSSKQTQERICM